MKNKKLHQKITHHVKKLQRFVNRVWYPPLLGLLALADNFIVVVPTDGLLVSSSMFTPKRWFWLALAVAIGSTTGALILAALVEWHGLPWILDFFPGVNESRTWQLTDQFFNQYGLIVVFAVAASPLMQQPTVILAGLAGTPLSQLAWAIFIGRFLKFLLFAYLGSHAPRLLSRMWGIQDEMEEAGVKLDASS